MYAPKWSSTETLVACEWIERASKKTRVGRHCVCCPRICFRRSCVEALYLYCGLMCLLSLTLLTIVATGVVLPFQRSLHFVRTRCTTLSTTYLDKPKNCLCSGHHCQSSYPCVHIRVVYNTTEGELEEAQLHQSQYDEGKCSYAPRCNQEKGRNDDYVTEFVTSFGAPNASFDCLYNPDDVSRVIRVRDGQHHHMLHLVLWPALVAVGSAMGVAIPYMVCGCGFLWRLQPPVSIRQEAELRRRGIQLSEYSHMTDSKEM